MEAVRVFVAVFVICVSCSFSEACFPAKYWISCLANTCSLGGRCPGDPTAICKWEKTPCLGCKAVWYTPDGQPASCGAKQNLKLCPGGEPVVHCKVNSCKWPCQHKDFKKAQCRQSYCGKCAAEYLIKDRWMKCPKTSSEIKGEMIPVDMVVSQGKAGPGGVDPDQCVKVPCSIEVCIGQRCPIAPRAVCRPDDCNTCKPAWFSDNQRIDCDTGEFIQTPADRPLVRPPNADAPWQRTCAVGEQLQACDHSVCEKKICRNFPNAICRPDGCGTCKDTWYVDNTLVDCLSDECPPRVPIVKCVDDPCKYFGHYCPTAECRASQCGKCEAKFFVNGTEIDCAMPPKVCPADVQPLSCPWFTCPANICPSNRRLMCRIDPCGQMCDHQWIDIYNGEEMLCRTFDGDGRPTGAVTKRPEKIFYRDPLARFFDASYPKQDQSAAPNAGNTQPVGAQPGFHVSPMVVKRGPPLKEANLIALLRSFPHEVAAVSSKSIQMALKKLEADKNMRNALIKQLPTLSTVDTTGSLSSMMKKVNRKPHKKKQKTAKKFAKSQAVSTLPKTHTMKENMFENTKTKPKFHKQQAVSNAKHSDTMVSQKVVDVDTSMIQSQHIHTGKPKLNQVIGQLPSLEGQVRADINLPIGKSVMNQHLMLTNPMSESQQMDKIAAKDIVVDKTIKSSDMAKTSKGVKTEGVPLSINLFTQLGRK